MISNSDTQFEQQLVSQEELLRREKLIEKGESDFRSAVIHLTQAQNLMFASSLQQNIAEAIKSFDDMEKEIRGIEKNSLKIKRILETTRILSINAAIEASRAGDSGRKFTIVADEIRNLANRTSESTNEVEIISSNMIEHGKKNQDALGKMETCMATFVTNINKLLTNTNVKELIKIEENGFILTLLAKRLENHADFITNLVENAGKLKNMADHRTCAFGKWYDANLSRYKHVKGFKEIYEPHKAFHADATVFNEVLDIDALTRLFVRSEEILSAFIDLHRAFEAEMQTDAGYFAV